MVETVRCPTCGATVVLQGTARPSAAPFCSRRCRLGDLGRWADGAYRVSRSLGFDDLELADEALQDRAVGNG